MQHNLSSRLFSLIMVFWMLCLAPTVYGGTGPFLIEGKPPAGGYFTHSIEPIPSDLIDIPMIPEIAGVFDTIDVRSFSILRRAVIRNPIDAARVDGQTHVAVLHLYRKNTDVALLVYEIPTPDEPNAMALQSNDDPAKVWQIDGDAFDQIGIRWSKAVDPQTNTESQFAGGSSEAGESELKLAQPYTASDIVLDTKTIRARFQPGFSKLSRNIENESYRVRLPKNYNHAFPAGVLVWISPTPNGRIPAIFHPLLDELGMIAIGVDNNGNQREITDRLQNHFDSVETLGNAYRIDRERVYLTGMSGGGRCSAMLQIAFPDVFAGAVPIVGMNSYHKAPTGDGAKYWPASLRKPSARLMRLLKERRIAGITGTADFNQPEMSVRQKLLTKDGINMRLDVIEGMAHTMPTAEQFGGALKWVDEPRRNTMVESFREAKEMLKEYREEFGDAEPQSQSQARAARLMLVKIINLAPYTEIAWEAAELLGYGDPG